jgi:hypothetical protein
VLRDQAGEGLPSVVYAARALTLAPLLIPRVGEFAPESPGPQ